MPQCCVCVHKKYRVSATHGGLMEPSWRRLCREAAVVKETQSVDGRGRAGGLKSRRMGGGDHMTSGYCSRYIRNTLVQQCEHEIDLHSRYCLGCFSQPALFKCTKTQPYVFDLCSDITNRLSNCRSVYLQTHTCGVAIMLALFFSLLHSHRRIYTTLNQKKKRTATSGLNWMCEIGGVSTQGVKLGN